jgi:endonuclease YncB( thermonuclease family)
VVHDFKRFPELTDHQMMFYYSESPHKQITENFSATVVRVHDGDTITLKWSERDFNFPLRFINIAAPELSEAGGEASKSWLEQQLIGKEVDIFINKKNRVEKWGRILGFVYLDGLDIGMQSVFNGTAITWELKEMMS